MHTHTLLIADDSIPIQRVIQLTFADSPIRVVACGDGQQALDLIAADRPDIVLACTSLPSVDGYAIARQISKQRRKVKPPVLLLTDRFEVNDDAKVKESGAKGILEKPFEPGVIMARVKHALGIQEPAGERASDPPKPARPRPTRRRRVAQAAQVMPTNGPDQAMSGTMRPEVLAQIVGAAAAHAIATYERSRGVAPRPAIQSPPGLRSAPAGQPLPRGPWSMPHHQPEAVDLQQLQREMGFDDFSFDLVPSVQPAGSVRDLGPAGPTSQDNTVSRGTAIAHADPQAPPTDWDQTLSGWLASEMRTDHVRRTVPLATDSVDLSGSMRTGARIRGAGAGAANRVLEPVRLALNGLGALTTRMRQGLRAAEGQARTNLSGLADRCRSVLAAMI